MSSLNPQLLRHFHKISIQVRVVCKCFSFTRLTGVVVCFLLFFQREAQEREEAEQVRLERMRKEQEEEKEVRRATAGILVPLAPIISSFALTYFRRADQ